jgi:PLP dependent protein
MPTVADNLAAIRERVAPAAERSGRAAGDVTLVVVSKTVPVEKIRAAVAAGATHLGENRVQEAEEKYATLGVSGQEQDKVGREGITLHMIGALQRNKVRRAAALFDRVQSVDRPELAFALEQAAVDMRPEGTLLPVLLEVNLTGEASKSGVGVEGLQALADEVAGCAHLSADGLMTIARLGASEAELHETFATLRRLLEDLRRTHPGDWRHLSMGMSDDFEIAIEEGATMIRLGRAIFGEREK